jgi:CelD/BcsL family acetyltransferase involved in cellulose biosynthesis
VRLGPFPITRLFVNATGDNIAETEHNDVLALPKHRDRVLKDFITHALNSQSDELSLTGFNDATATWIGKLWPAEVFDGHFSEAPFVALDRLRSEKKEYLVSLSSNTRSNIRRTLRAYESRFGKPSLRRASTADEARLWLRELITLHEKRWKAKGQPGAFSSKLAKDFHESIVRSSVENADGTSRMRLDLLRLQFGAETIGFTYNLVYQRRVNFYQGGFSYSSDDNRLRPGLALHALAIAHYLAEGLLEYDFLGGEPESVQYKRSLSTDVRRLAWTAIPFPTVKMALLARLRRLRRGLKSPRSSYFG